MASTITVIQITDVELRMLRGQWPNLSACACQQRGTSGELVADMKQMISAVKMDGSACVLVIPRREFVLKMLQLPSTDPKEILRMLTLQVPMIVPFDETQAIYNYRLIQSKDSGYSDVLAAIILNSTIQNYIDAVYAVGLSLSDVCISFDLNAVYVRKFLISQLKDLFCSAIVISDVKFSEVMIFQGGEIVFSYHLPYGKADVDKHGEMFALSVKQVVENYEKTDLGGKVRNVYLDDQLLDMENIKEHLLKDGSLQVEAINLFGRIPENVNSFIEKQQINSAWMPLLGYFSGYGKKNVKSFLPKYIRSSRARRKKRLIFLRFIVAFSVAIFLSVGLCWTVIYKHEASLRAVRRRIDVLDPALENLEAENNFLNIVMGQRSEESSVVYKIKEIYEMIPDEISLQHFSMRATGEFEMQGTALKGMDVNSLQSALVSSPLFKNIDLQYATKRKRFNKEYTEFKFIFKLTR